MFHKVCAVIADGLSLAADSREQLVEGDAIPRVLTLMGLRHRVNIRRGPRPQR